MVRLWILKYLEALQSEPSAREPRTERFWMCSSKHRVLSILIPRSLKEFTTGICWSYIFKGFKGSVKCFLVISRTSHLVGLKRAFQSSVHWAKELRSFCNSVVALSRVSSLRITRNNVLSSANKYSGFRQVDVIVVLLYREPPERSHSEQCRTYSALRVQLHVPARHIVTVLHRVHSIVRRLSQHCFLASDTIRSPLLKARGHESWPGLSLILNRSPHGSVLAWYWTDRHSIQDE